MKIDRQQFSLVEPIIGKAAVVGAGSMGSGIAAQFANAGIPVVLLDIPAAAGRNAFAEAGVQRQLSAGGFMHPAAAALVTIGNTEDDLAQLADADWIVEAITENLDAKRALYARLESVRKDGSIVSSNTSTLPLARLVAGQPARFARNFIITHFFNPPRQMQLVEIVRGPDTDPAVVQKAMRAIQAVLGKTHVLARDTPGFIANRIGCYWLAVGVIEAIRAGLGPEDADAVAARPFSVPATGIFGLMDLIGIDLVPLVWAELETMLPPSDALNAAKLTKEPAIATMIANKLHGRKTKAGFYRRTADGKSEIYDWTTGTYRAPHAGEPESVKKAGRDLRALCEQPDAVGGYAWTVLSQVVSYAAAVAPDIADDVQAIDTAMCLGYNWGMGPFALADRVGVEWIAKRLAAEGRAVPALLAKAVERGGFYAKGILATDGETAPPPDKAGSLRLPSGAAAKPVLATSGASLWDIGEGVACLQLHTKMNVLEPPVLDALEQALDAVPQRFRALVIGNEDARAFSAGANLSVIAGWVDAGDFATLENFLKRGHGTYLRLKYAAFPVVAAVFGLTLGGGCEMALHCDAIVAHAELMAGLPEVKVGIIPGWGGCTQLLARAAARGEAVPARVAFDTIFAGKPSSSAHQAREMGILRDGDTVTMNRGRLLADARARAIALADGYRAPATIVLPVSGPAGQRDLIATVAASGRATETDLTIAGHLATVLTGGSGSPGSLVPETAIMALEREALLALVRLPATRARIDHMLKTGKPLNN